MVVAEQGSGCAQRTKVVRPGGQDRVDFCRRRRRRRRRLKKSDGDGGMGVVNARGVQHCRFADRQCRLQPRVWWRRTYRCAQNVPGGLVAHTLLTVKKTYPLPNSILLPFKDIECRNNII